MAYVDADWLAPRDSRDGPAILAAPDGTLYWRSPRSRSLRAPSELEADAAASRVLAWTADRAVAAVPAKGPVEVIGKGAIAAAIRHVLNEHTHQDAGDSRRPAAAVVVESSLEALLASTRRVADGGVVVAVSEVDEPFDFDVYPDIHARGLTLRGVPGPLAHSSDCDEHSLAPFVRELLVTVPLGERLTRDAAWMRLSPESP